MFVQSFIRIIYNLVIAIMLAFLVGFGINVFYVAPSAPVYEPMPLATGLPCKVIIETPSVQAPVATNSSSIAMPPCYNGNQDTNKYENDFAQYQKDLNLYHNRVGEISTALGVLFAILGIILFFTLLEFSAGFFMGGLFTFFYGLSQAMLSADMRVEFVLVCIGFLATLIVGYIVFIRKTLH